MTRKNRHREQVRKDLLDSTIRWVGFHKGARARTDSERLEADRQAEQEREQQMVLAFVTEGLGE